MAVSADEFEREVRNIRRDIDKLRDQLLFEPREVHYLDPNMNRRVSEIERKLAAVVALLYNQQCVIEKLHGYIEDILMDESA